MIRGVIVKVTNEQKSRSGNMIIEFRAKNWMSFKNEVRLSAVASRERQHRETLSLIPKYDLRVLPLIAIYGGNASGKSNLVKAMNFVRRFVVNATEPEAPTGVRAFSLNSTGVKEATEFTVLFLLND